MIEGLRSLVRLVKNSYSVLRVPLPASRKAALCWNLLHPSEKMLGFEISSFRRSDVVSFYGEIFARQNYRFQAASESPLICDCGANIGMATLYFKWLYPKARIEAFEPDPKTFSLLEKNVARNRLTDVITHNCALWDENGSVDFFVDPATPGSVLMSADPSRMVGQPIQVPSRRLSDFIQEPIDLLKLDVEGAEHRILNDLVRSGRIELVREMIIEFHHHIGTQRSCLASFLHLIENAGFEYQIEASVYPVNSRGVFQDILITAYR
jgi:FkbM family methyltransferase